MPIHIIEYIWKYSKWQQLLLIVLTFALFPLLYLTLEIPKLIINDVLSMQPGTKNFLLWEFQPLTLLILLSFSLLGLVILSGLFKVYINTKKGKVGETLIRRFRYQLMTQLLQFPLQRFERMPSGEISITIVQETDPLAGFAGESFALPVFQGGTLLTILLFMFMQDWILGVASLALVPVQLFIIPYLQRQINLLRKQRIHRVRVLSSRVVETVDAIDEVHIQGTRRYTLAEFSYRFGELYKIRLAIFKKKFFMKFLNNLMGHMTPFLFFAVGGYLILEGRLTIGALIAAIAAHKDFLSPWKELLNYYQAYQDNAVKYQNILEQFYPNASDRRVVTSHSGPVEQSPTTALMGINNDAVFSQPLYLRNVSLYNELGETLMQNINLVIKPGEKIAVVAEDSSEAKAFARTLCGLIKPSQGEVALGDRALSDLPESFLRQNMGFVTARPHLFNAALSYNLAYGLNHVPPPIQDEQQAELDQAIKAGTSPDWFDESFESVWTNLPRLEAAGWSDVLSWIYEQMRIVGASEHMINLALHEVFDPANYGDDIFGTFTQRLLLLRGTLQQRLLAEENANCIEVFHKNEFLRHSSLEENLLFGTCNKDCDETRAILINELAKQMIEHDIMDESHSITTLVLQQLIDGYNNGTLSQHILKGFNLLENDELSRLQHINNLPKIAFKRKEERNTQNFKQVMSIFLKIVPADWRSVEFSEPYRQSIIAIRHSLMVKLKKTSKLNYHIFDEDHYNPGLSVFHNVLFGRFDENCPDISALIQNSFIDLVREEQLEANLIQLMIINNQAGVGGNRIPEPTRHTLNLARTLLKKPSILVLHEALLPLTQSQQEKILFNIKDSHPSLTLVWISSQPQHTHYFDRSYHLQKTLYEINEQKKPENHNFPERPLSLLVAYNAGGATDYQTRIVTMMSAALNTQNEAKYLGQPLVVVNHPGRGGRDGWNHFVDYAGIDGYQLAVYNLPHMIAQAIKLPDRVRYTPDKLEPIANWGADPAVFIVARNSPFHSMADVLRFAKKRGKKLTLSGAGLYVGHHIAALQLDQASGIQSHYISGSGGENALKMVIRRQVTGGFNNLSDAYRNRDKIRVLAVADIHRNDAYFPDVPTFLEQGIAVDDASINFRGIMAPHGLAEEQLTYLAEVMGAMFADEMVIEKMHEAGAPLRIIKRDALKDLWRKRQRLISELLAD